MGLWCVFEAHLAMERGLTIALPKQPKAKHVAKALVPGFVIFTVPFLFSLRILLSNPQLMPGSIESCWTLRWIESVLAFVILCCTRVALKWPQAGSWLVLFILGLYLSLDTWE